MAEVEILERRGPLPDSRSADRWIRQHVRETGCGEKHQVRPLDGGSVQAVCWRVVEPEPGDDQPPDAPPAETPETQDDPDLEPSSLDRAIGDYHERADAADEVLAEHRERDDDQIPSQSAPEAAEDDGGGGTAASDAPLASEPSPPSQPDEGGGDDEPDEAAPPSAAAESVASDGEDQDVAASPSPPTPTSDEDDPDTEGDTDPEAEDEPAGQEPDAPDTGEDTQPEPADQSNEIDGLVAKLRQQITAYDETVDHLQRLSDDIDARGLELIRLGVEKEDLARRLGENPNRVDWMRRRAEKAEEEGETVKVQVRRS